MISSYDGSTSAEAEQQKGAGGPSWLTGTLLLLIVGGSILLRMPFLSVPMITDEGGYAYVARFWSSDYQLYRDIPFDPTFRTSRGVVLDYSMILKNDRPIY